MISILVLIPVVAIIVIFLITAAIKAGPEKGGDEVIKKVYLYLVLFTTLMMIIGGSVAAFMAAADIVSPTAYYQSFEDYKRYSEHEKSNVEGDVKLSEEELLIRYNDMVATEKERQAARAKNSLLKSLGWIIIPFPVFVYSQRRLAKKDQGKE
ncbi:MAG: hypothetical protein ACOX2N_05205 [Peptococcia bacterium]